MKKVSPNASGVKLVSKTDFTPSTPEEENLLNLDMRVALIQALIPLGLVAVTEELQKEVTRLAGEKTVVKLLTPPIVGGAVKGIGVSVGSKVPIRVPRVRDVDQNAEVPLEVYHRFQVPRGVDDGLLLRVLKGISNRNYEACAEAVPQAFGLSASTVSRRFIKASAEKLRQFQERSLASYDLVALFLDGKTFADQEMIIALGVTIEGHKIPLGFVQAATENERVCRQFIQTLMDRGLRYEQGLLCLIDGSKGLHSALTKAMDGYVVIQRCQWHKRENVLSYLAKNQQGEIKSALQHAYDLQTYAEAKSALNALKPALALMNESALNSLDEGLEETLTLHRLGLMPLLRQSFRTTNCIESLNSMVAQATQNVKHWKNSNQRSRWLATALLDSESRLRKIKGFRYLPMLRLALQKELNLIHEDSYTLSAD